MDDILTMHALKNREPELPLAQAFVRSQPWEGTFKPDEGLKNGTVFPNLYKPYAGWQPLPECK
jgi:hypothetical protein